MTVAPDNTIYAVGSFDGSITKITPDGRAVRLNPFPQIAADEGVPLPKAIFAAPNSVAVGQDGSLFIADRGAALIYRAGGDGILHIVAGSHNGLTDRDGVLATEAFLAPTVRGLDVGPDGTVYFSTGDRIRAVRPDGILVTAAGGGSPQTSVGDGTPAVGAPLSFLLDVKAAPDDTLLFTSFDNTIKRILPAFPGLSLTEIAVADESGGALYIFDASGRHLRTLNTLTGAILRTFSYDAAGYLISTTDADGNVLQIERDPAEHPLAIVAPGGQRTQFSLDGAGYLSTITNAANETTTLVHSGTGLLGSLEAPRGGIHRFGYDADGRLSTDSDPANGSTTLSRAGTTEAFTVTRTTAEGRMSHLAVNTSAAGSDHSDIGTDGLLSQIHFDQSQAVTSSTSDGMTATVASISDPRFGLQSATGAAVTMSAPSGLSLSASSKQIASLSDKKNPLSLTGLTETLSVNGRTTTNVFDAIARRWTVTSPLGRKTITSVSSVGRPTQYQIGNLAPTAFGYDARGRLASVNISSRSSGFTYDDANRLTAATDPLGRSIGFTYDAADRISTETLPDGRVIGFAYDVNGNVTSVTPTSRPAHTFLFTPVDLLSTYTPPPIAGTGSTQYTWNRDHQLTLLTRPDTTTISFGYDGAGRLSSLASAMGTQTFTYDPARGHLVSSSTPDGNTMTYSYDGSLLTGVGSTGGVSAAVGFTYDNDFRVASEMVNGGNRVTFLYDADSLLTHAGDLTLMRDAQAGLLTGTTIGQVSDNFTRNEFGEVTGYTASVNGTPLLGITYTRDGEGRIAGSTETVNGVATAPIGYEYDTAGRLVRVTSAGATTAECTYDGNSNRATYVDLSGSRAATYDTQDRLLSYGDSTYAYSASGELQSRTTLGQTTTFTYDALGNLRTVGIPGRTITYVIDAQNRRVGKKVDGVLVKGWVYADQLHIVAETDGAGAVVSRFVYGSRANTPDYMIRGGITYRIISDHLGSPRFVVNTADGTIAEAITYDPFGAILTDTAPGFQPFAFAGGLYDSDTALIRFGARDYDPLTSRWTTKDPLSFGAGDANLYGYALSDPIDFTDPNGKWAGVDELVGGAIGGVLNTGAYVAGQLIKYHGNIHCISGGDLAVTFGIGFVAGFFATDTFGASIAVGATANTAQYIGIQAVHGRSVTGTGLAGNALLGVLGGAVSSAARGAEASTIDSIARGTPRYTSTINPIDRAFNAAPGSAAAGYVSNSDPDCGCR